MKTFSGSVPLGSLLDLHHNYNIFLSRNVTSATSVEEEILSVIPYFVIIGVTVLISA